MSVGKLCDDNCLNACDKIKFTMHKNKHILKERRFPMSGMVVTYIANPLLWTTMKVIHANLQQLTSIERMYFLHGTLGYPPLSSLIREIVAGYLL